jgi:type II pantothenate kinase
MIYSIDFGGSTIDVVSWENGMPVSLRSYERYKGFNPVKPADFLKARKKIFKNAEKIFVTGGRSFALADSFIGTPVKKVGEIEAIGRGGCRLLESHGKPLRICDIRKLLVVSMGTGTCMVEVRMGKEGYLGSRHVGGTGVGGGTFTGLCAKLLDETSPAKLKKMFLHGDRKKVDLSVFDIVGGGIGVIPGEATASNLAKISRSIDFSRSDLAAGIVGLIGQTIGILATFAAKAHKCDLVLLCGKLTAMEQVTEAVLSAGEMYKVKMMVPDDAGFVAAMGAYRN